MWSFSLWSPEDTSWLWRQLSNAPCLGYFGIYLVNPQHRQCPAVYTSGRTSSFQQQKHIVFPSSDLSLYRPSGTAKHWACLPSVQVPYWVCCAVYHTSLILFGFRPSEIARGYLWKCLCESQCQWHMRLTHILHLKVPYEACNSPRSLLASSMSSTYRTRKRNLLPLTFRYIHWSTLFSLNPLVILTSWNLRYHWREDSSVYRLP